MCARARVHRLVTRVPNVIKMKCASEETKEINSILLFSLCISDVRGWTDEMFLFLSLSSFPFPFSFSLCSRSQISPPKKYAQKHTQNDFAMATTTTRLAQGIPGIKRELERIRSILASTTLRSMVSQLDRARRG